MEENKTAYASDIQAANTGSVEEGLQQQMKLSGPVASPAQQVAPVSVNDQGNTSARTSPQGDMEEGGVEDVQETENTEVDNTDESGDADVGEEDIAPSTSETTGEEETDEAVEEDESEETEEVEEEEEEEEYSPPLAEAEEERVNSLDVANNLLKDAPGRQRFY